MPPKPELSFVALIWTEKKLDGPQTGGNRGLYHYYYYKYVGPTGLWLAGTMASTTATNMSALRAWSLCLTFYAFPEKNQRNPDDQRQSAVQTPRKL